MEAKKKRMFNKVNGAALFKPNFANVNPPAHNKIKMTGAALINGVACVLLSVSGDDIVDVSLIKLGLIQMMTSRLLEPLSSAKRTQGA